MNKCDRAVELLDRMGRIVHGLQFAHGLNPAQWEALRFLARANCYSRSPTALSEYLGTTKGTASQTVIALESKGMVKRTRRATDRRSVELEVTPLGLEMIQKDPLAPVFEAASNLGAEQCEAMNAALIEVVASLQLSIGFAETGRCIDCTHFCKERPASSLDDVCRCALSQEEMAPQDLQRICTNFEPVS
jgi:DNA-binding MarR family transcriptional regulator